MSFAGAGREELNAAVHRLDRQLQGHGFPGYVEAVPGMASLLVYYDAGVATFPQVVRHLQTLRALPSASAGVWGRLWTIPVWYGGEAGPDLPTVALACGLDEKTVISLHCGSIYTVYFLGFMAGFPYMGPLPAAIDLPRRATPRLRVPAGSVAIAAGQSGIYPFTAPGGWHLIGRTPARIWDPGRTPPALLGPGDRVRFRPVGEEEFLSLASRADGGVTAEAVP